MRNNIHVLYHRDCADGFGAAWAAHRELGREKVEYLPCTYGEPPPEMESGSRVYILDFDVSRRKR